MVIIIFVALQHVLLVVEGEVGLLRPAQLVLLVGGPDSSPSPASCAGEDADGEDAEAIQHRI